MNRTVKWSHVVRALAGAALLSAALVGVSACAAYIGGGGWVMVAPPAPIVEVRTAPPAMGFVWVPGFYRWDGRDYLWISGRWQRPPHRGARWEPGRWERRGNRGWHYREGRWR